MTMIRNFLTVLFLCMTMVALPAAAQASQTATIAEEAILVDMQTGQVLLEKEPHKHMPTSSMSKTMTIYMVFEALKDGRLKLEDEVLVSEKAWRKGGSKMFIKVGAKVKVEDLIRGVIVQSGNDAAIALAEALGGSEEVFAASMNQKAQELGMTDSNFVNASGWPDPDHYSSARDLAILSMHLIRDFPEYYHYFAEKEFTYNDIHQNNRNPLLFRNMGVDGLKTGHTEVAGYGLMASAERNGRRLVLVVNGLESEQQRADEAARLLEWGFRSFKNVLLFEAGDEVTEAKIWMGQPKSIPLVVKDDVFVTIPIAEKDKLKVKVIHKDPLSAPVAQGDEVGELVVEVPGLGKHAYTVVAGAAANELGLFNQVMAKAQFFLMGQSSAEPQQ